MPLLLFTAHIIRVCVCSGWFSRSPPSTVLSCAATKVTARGDHDMVDHHDIVSGESTSSPSHVFYSICTHGEISPLFAETVLPATGKLLEASSTVVTS